MDVEFDDQFDDWTENSSVRFLFGFGVEVEKSSIFHEYCKINYQGRAGWELVGNREEKARERET